MAGIARLAVFHRPTSWRLVLIQWGVLASFALIPVWYRFTVKAPAPFGLAPLRVSYFLMLLPMLWTIGCWLVFGLPGFSALRRDPARRLWAFFLMLLALWALASTTWAFMRVNEPQVALNAAVQLAVVALFSVAAACAGPSARTVVRVLVVMLIFTSLISVAQAALQHSIGFQGVGEYTFSPDQSGISVVQAGDVRWVRPYGLHPHPNLNAGALMIGWLACAALLFSERRRLRWTAAAAFVLGVSALLLTFSRGAWVGAAVGVFAILPLLRTFLRQRERRVHLAAVAALVVVLGLAFVVTFRPLLGARAGAGSENTELRSVSDRLVYTDFAMRSISERTVLGVGMGNFPWRASYYLVETFYDLRGDNVHHVLLSAWAELGLVGVLLAVSATITGIEAGLRVLRRRDLATDDRAARIALLAVVMALLAVGLIDHYPWTLIQFQVAWWGSLGVVGRVMDDDSIQHEVG